MSSQTKSPIIGIILLFSGVIITCFILYKSANPLQFLPFSTSLSFSSPSTNSTQVNELEVILERASNENKTVIITTLNRAWAEPNSTFDLFLKSFRVGQGTEKLLNNLVAVCLDPIAYNRCLEVHSICYSLTTAGNNFTDEAFFMSQSYLDMMWRRIEFLTSVLELGYSFVFTDADIMWLRDPFSRFFPNGDFQIACDNFYGNPLDLNNRPNGGFTYVKSNNRSIEFYKFWYSSRLTYPGKHDQDVLNVIKKHPFIREIGLQIRFLDTVYFGGFCEPSKDLNVVCTMHANCCVGLWKKVHDLNLVLEDWSNFLSLNQTQRAQSKSWSVPSKCGF